MESYKNFIGIDIGKFHFMVATHHSKEAKEYEYNASGIEQFLKDYKKELPHAFCVLESTGGFEIRLLLRLCEKKINVHKAHPRQVKHFIRSLGKEAKTDKLDAKSLALYGAERWQRLDRFQAPSEQACKLYELAQRRRDLRQMLIAEKNRLQAPRTEFVKESIQALVTVLSGQIKQVTAEIDALIEQDSLLKKKKKILMTIAGIGNVIANELLILLPELGQLSRREIASLVGLAPLAKESGQFKGYRRTGYGRGGIKPMLFLAAMAARNSKSHFKIFYEGLVSRGKNKMVALVALMRKLIVVANARLKSIPAT